MREEKDPLGVKMCHGLCVTSTHAFPKGRTTVWGGSLDKGPLQALDSVSLYGTVIGWPVGSGLHSLFTY